MVLLPPRLFRLANMKLIARLEMQVLGNAENPMGSTWLETCCIDSDTDEVEVLLELEVRNKCWSGISPG